jgi:hypothetical protein
MITMNAAPVWLLDIDGVLNAICDDPDDAVWPLDQWVRAEATCAGVQWPLLAALPVLHFVRRIHEAGLAEIRWHTTWQHEATGVARALDLPDFPVEPCPEFTGQGQRVGGAAPTGPRWWKLAAAERIIDGGRSLLWTDDDADNQLRQHGDSPLSPDGEQEDPTRVPTVLIICPRPNEGMTAAHLSQIAEFLDCAAGRLTAPARRAARGARAPTGVPAGLPWAHPASAPR